MADKSIGDLNFAPGTVDDSNTLFVVQQAGAAYKLSGHNFILALTTILDGHGGVASIEQTGTSGLVDTYTITYADQTTTTFTVNNGNGVTGITQYWAVSSSNTTVPSSWSTTRQTMTATNRYLWSYLSFTLDSGTIDTPKSVVGVYGDTGDSWYVWIRYAGQMPTSDADIGTTPDDWIGIYSGTASTAPTSYTAYTWFQYKGDKGDQGDPAVITQQSVTYQEGTSGTVAPSGTWVANVPTVTPGNFLWTRTVLEFNDGTSVTSYSISRYGIDGTGSVSTVNNVSPDTNGNIALTATDIPTSDNQSVQTRIDSLVSENGSQNQAIYDVAVSLADFYSTSSSYSVGDYCVYGRSLYKCTTAISGGEAWNAAHWTKVAIMEEMDANKQDTLVSGTNIKTVNGASLLGSGNIATGNAFTVTLASASWSSNAQTVSNAYFVASGYAYIVSPASASFADYGTAQIYADDVTTDGQMTFHCTDVPSGNLTVNIARVVAS